MKQMFNRVIVLGGGNSPEREVSLRSSKAVVEACQNLGYETLFIDPAKQDIANAGLKAESDIVLPILHGAGGEDGTIQAVLEDLGIRFLGSDARSSRICFNKIQTRKVLQDAGLPLARGNVVNKENYHANQLSHVPHVLKDPLGGSSIGTVLVRQLNGEKQQEIENLFNTTPELLIEELIEGVELTVPILDKKALPVIEIKPPENGEFDYENKYNGKTEELCPPVSVSSDIQTKVQQLASDAHQAAGCRHLSRVDIMLNQASQPFILEINTIPGLTNQSLFPKSAKVAGLSFETLVQQFISMAEAS